ncbi:MAG: molybdenum cofactor biosynthesis protein MoaE [Candidatus Competibacteraceae bacterium]|jgi:molybdopterin synthase catalytic subunit|nr:molybdenum cofactor biosynthesis protein MoaE [Candidatus Competibacteraceae bacterium]
MTIEIRETPFDPYAVLAHYQEGMTELQGRYGATASFVGTMRDHNEGSTVTEMILEHYPGMTERHLQHIVAEAQQQWPLLDTLIVHRVGALQPNDTIVLVAVWSAHRTAAFESCRFIMEALKSRAPFWKKEALPAGERWVASNTAG